MRSLTTPLVALGATLLPRGLPLRRGPAPRRADPAPTVWSYRYQRIMLTPLYRRLIVVGLPVMVMALSLGGWFSVESHRAALSARVEALLDSVRERPAFMVSAVEVTGADDALTAAIGQVAPVALPLSSFDLDLDGIRSRVAELTAVRSVAVRVRPGGTLEIAVSQRQPVAVWRYIDGLRLIDAEGVMTGMIASRGDRADLPLIAGDGAKEAIGEALALFAAAAPVAPRVRGLVRMGERRWDLVLDDEMRVLLPADGAVPALERVIVLHQAQEMLDRDVAVVDMRLSSRPTLRLHQPALNILRNVTATAVASAPATPLPLPESN